MFNFDLFLNYFSIVPHFFFKKKKNKKKIKSIILKKNLN